MFAPGGEFRRKQLIAAFAELFIVILGVMIALAAAQMTRRVSAGVDPPTSHSLFATVGYTAGSGFLRHKDKPSIVQEKNR